MKFWILVILGKFEILNPSGNRNLRSLTLTPNLDFGKNFVIFVTKMMKIDFNFCEIDQICYNLKTEFWDP